MISTWSVNMAKNHHCISVVYRDTTQADYDVSGETYNHPSPRHTSTSSSHLDTGDSSFFLDDLRKPSLGSSDLKESALPSLQQLDDVFLFDLPNLGPLSTDLPSPTRLYGGLTTDKVLTPLDKANQAAEARLAHEFSAATMDMWEQNETFQDLSELIQEGKTAATVPSPSQPNYLVPLEPSHRVPSSSSSGVITSTAATTSSRACPASEATWQPPPPPPPSLSTSAAGPSVPIKRALSPIGEAGPSHANDGSLPKMPKFEEPEERYSEMRSKNNMASRRSRMTRKEKELEMEKKAAELEQDNELLRIKVKSLEELTEKLKRHLINSIVKK
ncbi:uncharacterized protein LOC144178608 isoform X1 [Haemaphysalis longicornis]